MNIFILEDDIFQQQKLEKLIERVASNLRLNYQSLYSTAKPANLLARIDNATDHQIYFLDIDIKGSSKKGLEVAQDIRKKDPYGTIVFVTTHSEFAPVTFAYKVSALDFIDKSLPSEELEIKITDCLTIAAQYCEEVISNDAFFFENQNTSFQVPFSDILYFETTDISHKTRLVTKNRLLEFYADLHELQDIDHRLFRCHRAFIVNLGNVVSINKSEKIVTFDNGEACLVSRRLLKKTIEQMTMLEKNGEHVSIILNN